MKCDSPYLLVKAGNQIGKKGKVYNEDVTVPCGKCPPCKLRRVQDWTFRMNEEEKVSSSSHFVTLTYAITPKTPNGFGTLRKKDYQIFLKRLRRCQEEKIRYFICGEYGTERFRPHYHIILFNLHDPENIAKCWQHGKVDIGHNVTEGAMAYTIKYIDKTHRIPMHRNDDREKEFSHQSKGIGKSFLTKERIDFHKSDLTRLHVVNSTGHTVSMPRYYRKRLFTEEERDSQIPYIKKLIKAKETMQEKDFLQLYGKNASFAAYTDGLKRAREQIFYHSSKITRDGQQRETDD